MSESAETIINTYKMMTSECSQISAKIQEFNFQKDEHRLVIDTLTKLEPERKAFRLVAGVLVERSVGEVLPEISANYESVRFYFITIKITTEILIYSHAYYI